MAEQAQYKATKSLRDMTPAERAEHWAQVDVVMKKVQVALSADARRRNLPTECMIVDYLRWGRTRMQCILMVRRAHPSTAAIKVSRDGSDASVAFLPLSRVELRPQTSGGFVLAMVPKWLREKMPPEFCSVTPSLTGDNWTDAEREEWKDLSAICRKINCEIEWTPIRSKWRQPSRITSAISPGNAA